MMNEIIVAGLLLSYQDIVLCYNGIDCHGSSNITIVFTGCGTGIFGALKLICSFLIFLHWWKYNYSYFVWSIFDHQRTTSSFSYVLPPITLTILCQLIYLFNKERHLDNKNRYNMLKIHVFHFFPMISDILFCHQCQLSQLPKIKASFWSLSALPYNVFRKKHRISRNN